MAKLIQRNIAEASKDYSRIFGGNKNLYRIAASMQDGLKPVDRRFLFTLYSGKGRHKAIKLSTAVGNTLDYHPHGDSSITDVAAKLVQVQINNAAPVRGIGNFGSYKDSEAAAARYIECSLSQYGYKCFFEDFNNMNVDMKLAYTGDGYEPEVLPARYPHVLFNPRLSGIGYGAASNIPPFNLTEVMNATITLMKNPKAKICLIPDSPTGADIIDDGQFQEINDTGVGKFTLRGTIEIDAVNNIINIKSIPLQITIDDIIANIVHLKNKKLFDEITDIKDYTNNKRGVDCKIYLKSNANIEDVVDRLYKKDTGLKKTYSCKLSLIDDYALIDYGIKTLLLEWIDWRRECIRSSYNSMLVKCMEDYHMNEVLLFIFNKDNIEQTIKISRTSKNRDEYIRRLVEKYDITTLQASTVTNMRTYNFNADSYQSYKDKKVELKNEMERIEHILSDDAEIDKLIIEQLKEGIKLFGRPRMSKVVQIDTVDDVTNTTHVVAISKDGYIKKLPEDVTSIGQVGESNGIYMTMQMSNRDSLIVFNSLGQVSKVNLAAIPDVDAKDIGVTLERYFTIAGDIVSVLVKPFKSKDEVDDMYITFVTKNGFAKKTSISEFYNIRDCKTCIQLNVGDELTSVIFSSKESSKDIIIYTNLGDGVRLDLNDIKISKANTKGLPQISLQEGEYVVDISTMEPSKKYLLYVTSAGRFKITETKYFPIMQRKDDAISLINLDKNETLLGIQSVTKKEKVLVYRKIGEPVYVDLKELPVSLRVAKAEKLVKTPKGDCVLNYKLITH